MVAIFRAEPAARTPGQSSEAPAGAPLRVAIVGCGAITRLYHLPVLAGHDRARVTALVDRNPQSAETLAKAYGVSRTYGDASQLTREEAAAVLVAVPAALHHDVCVPLLRRGFHVFVEKPMATSQQDAEAMAAAAREAGVVLAVGHFRRLFASTRLLRALIASNMLGAPQSFLVEEGHLLDWPSSTLALMRRDLAGGGVLLDTGSHPLDQFLSVFDSDAEVLEYLDNQLGGVESDCRGRLRVWHEGRAVDGSFELSRTRRLRNICRIVCERGTLDLSLTDRYRVNITPTATALTDAAHDAIRAFEMQARWIERETTDPYAPFRAQIDDWLDAIARHRDPYLSAASTLRVVRLVEACYARRQPLAESWVEAGLDSARLHAAATGAPAVLSTGRSTSTRRVLVTGAAGFIGTRACELFALRYGYDVRALVHNPANASRVARLPVELMVGDLRSDANVASAVADCDAVVHCAYGTAWGDRKGIRDVTVGGTKRLASAAMAARVSRFVHISTTAVHGTNITGDHITEATPVRPDADLYQQTKAQAETVFHDACRAGLSAVMLRLPNVYGPFSGPFTLRPLSALRNGEAVLLGDGRNPSNTIYVDNVVSAMAAAVEASPEVSGETFVIVDEPLSWADYHGFYAELLGVAMRSLSYDEWQALRRAEAANRPSLGTYLRGLKTVLTSAEMAALGGSVLSSEHLGALPRAVLERFPGFKRVIKRRLRLDTPAAYTPDAGPAAASPSTGLFNLYAIAAPVDAAKARTRLGWTCLVDRAQALSLTADWLTYSQLIP